MPSGAYNRKKGLDFERSCAAKFRLAMPGAVVRRNIQARGGMEDKVADLEMPIFAPECKRTAQPNIRRAYEQATQACPTGKVPCAITRANGKGQVVLFTLSLDDMVDFIAEYYESRAE